MRSIPIVASIACALVSSAAFAVSCAGHNINSSISADSAELSSGASIVTLRLMSVHVSDDPGSPMHLAAGECAGALASLGGTLQGQGHCIRKDKDGDVYNEQWNLAPGAERGSWKLVGGTGKYARMTGSGWWQLVMSEGKAAAVRWVGTCQ